MKTDPDKTSSEGDRKKSYEIDMEAIADIMERINGLSFEGQRQIIAYLKTLAEKNQRQSGDGS